MCVVFIEQTAAENFLEMYFRFAIQFLDDCVFVCV